VKSVVVADRKHRERFVSPEALTVLEAAGPVGELDLAAIDTAEERRAAVEDALSDADAVVFAPWGSYGLEEFSPACWRVADHLRAIAGTFGYRFEEFFSVELGELEGQGVVVVDTSRSNSPTVAEFGLAMILNLLRDIPDDVALVRRGGWRDVWDWKDDGAVSGELTGRRVGLAGFGAICRRLAQLLAPFGCSLSAFDPFVAADVVAAAGVTPTRSLAELASGSEIFVVGIPRTPATLGVVDHTVIDALPRGALFLLLTRMAVVDQQALWARTSSGELRAAVDVYEPEPPPPDSPFRTDPNVLPTPHIGGNTAAVNRRCFLLACREAVAALEGRPLSYRMTARDAELYSGRIARETRMPEEVSTHG
jgi:phosphoglycerate dehydrogenase-like enzyme